MDTREKGEHHDIGIEEIMRLHGTHGVGAADEGFVITDMNTDFGYRRIVKRTEGIEILSIDFEMCIRDSR